MANLLDYSNWTLGTGSITGPPAWTGRSDFDISGENERTNQTDPWGRTSIVWECGPTTNTGSPSYEDGGFDSDYIDCDYTKTYRFSVWINRTYGTGGALLFGIKTFTSGEVAEDHYKLNPGATGSNNFFLNEGYANLDDTFEDGVWKLCVAFCHDSSYAGSTSTETGTYSLDGTKYGSIDSDVKFLGTSIAKFMMQVIPVYSSYPSTTSVAYAAFPRIDLVDGSEPTIQQLIQNSSGSLGIKTADGKFLAIPFGAY